MLLLFEYGKETLIFYKFKYDLMRPVLCYWEVVRFFKTFQSFDQITTLTYVLMDSFCPCFLVFLSVRCKIILFHPHIILKRAFTFPIRSNIVFLNKSLILPFCSIWGFTCPARSDKDPLCWSNGCNIMLFNPPILLQGAFTYSIKSCKLF